MARKGLLPVGLLAAVLAAAPSAATAAEGWKPTRTVELIIRTSPGGSNDIAGRTVHRVWSELKLLPVPSAVVNRSGGEHSIAYTYVSQRGDPHTIGMMSTPMLVSPLGGRTQLTHHDVTPLAYLFTEPMIVLARAESPLKTGKEAVEALRKDPAALSVALTSNGHRISIGMPLAKAGVAIKSVRMPAFKGGGETVTAVMGGHADLVVTSVSTSVPHVPAGTMRGLAVSSNSRLGGPLPDVPTWRELGYQSSGSWKGVMGPKGMSADQIAYWEEILRKVAQSEALREYADKNQWLLEFKGAADTRKWLDEEYALLKVAMTELGLARASQ